MPSPSLQIGLNIVTLVMCVLTLAMATAALMPQIQHGMRLLRTGLMYSTFAAVLGIVGFVGWSRFLELRAERLEQEATSTTSFYDLQSAPAVPQTIVREPTIQQPDPVLQSSLPRREFVVGWQDGYRQPARNTVRPLRRQ